MNHPSIEIVVAMAENRVIGRDGDLPWRLPADMARFRALTMGKPIVMGRRTHESIGRALDGRLNIVVTRRPGYRAPGCTVSPSLDTAFEAAAGAESGTEGIAVIGGASIYEAALPLAARIHLTLVHASIDGDVRFPRIDSGEWQEISRLDRPADARNPYDLSFIELIERSPSRYSPEYQVSLPIRFARRDYK
ncbi:MAG: dihydrofolate reductase [Gammaproteobacteria bacterium]|nr:dihydrofolate reductase [Gammaproteobacteria bacterium]